MIFDWTSFINVKNYTYVKTIFDITFTTVYEKKNIYMYILMVNTFINYASICVVSATFCKKKYNLWRVLWQILIHIYFSYLFVCLFFCLPACFYSGMSLTFHAINFWYVLCSYIRRLMSLYLFFFYQLCKILKPVIKGNSEMYFKVTKLNNINFRIHNQLWAIRLSRQSSFPVWLTPAGDTIICKRSPRSLLKLPGN